ncbi:unnamed protein product [Linum trigynum]|uniref:Vesicle-fusing ATPase n=1 Tax=Linum trigynum TaxID=586398 RepID=A0AAV2FIA9_9ROSI
MAGRFGFGSSAPAKMRVTNTPSTDLALTNLAYCSATDLHNFAVPGTKLFMALIADRVVLNLSYPFALPRCCFISLISARRFDNPYLLLNEN